ncbi:MAG: GTPase HflX [Fervidobacterium sp.]
MKHFLSDRAILLAVESIYNKHAAESILELEQLCETLNITVVDKVIQRRDKPDPATYIGSGKLEKIKTFCIQNNVNLIIFDDEITPVQQRNVEKITNLKVLDRTQVILEIFYQHAFTKEGKIQVEIAKLSYELPRLRGKGVLLSNLGGGIGTRGPGETALELDRRKIRERLKYLKRELEKIKLNRSVSRKARIESGFYIFSVVGYTNAGKSTLLSALSNESDILISNKLFSTLNPTVRKVKLPNGRIVLFTDTVGFINKLPHTLVEAFHSTLEEISYAHVLLLLVDAGDPFYREKIDASFKVLDEIKATDKPMAIVFNKIDLVPVEYLENLRYNYPEAVFISALQKIGFDALYSRILRFIHEFDYSGRLNIPTFKVGELAKFSEFIEWSVIEEREDELVIDLKGTKSIVEKITKYLQRN